MDYLFRVDISGLTWGKIIWVYIRDNGKRFNRFMRPPKNNSYRAKKINL